MPERNLPPRQANRWSGMHHDSRAKLDRNPVTKALYAQNFYLEDGRWVGRLGTDQLGSQLAASKVQGVVEFSEVDGTIHILAFCNADMFEYDSGTDSWSSTDLSGESISMDPSQDLDFANSRGRLIVTDGVNKPWMWDPNAGTFTTLNEAPIADGVAVYYDQVFFFGASGNARKFEWSDIGDPTDGYDADGQSWEFVQTDAGAVLGMAPLNNVMLVMKQDSVSYLRGKVGSQFQTDAVREGLSETEGTISGKSVVILDGDVFWLSQNGPRAAVGGQKLVRINEDENGDDRLRDTWESITRSTWDNAYGLIDTTRRHVWWVIPDDDIVLVYAVDEDAWQVFKFPWTVEAAADVEFAGGKEYVLIGDDNGNVYRYGKASTWSDSGGNSIERKLQSPLYGQSFPNQVKRMVELHLTFEVITNLDFTLKANTDGTLGAATSAPQITKTGRQRYRRGFNAVGVATGWEFVQDTAGQTVNIESAMTLQTLVGSYPDTQ